MFYVPDWRYLAIEETFVDAPKTMRRRQAALSAQMRATGRTWVEVAAAFRTRFNLNPRAAFRLARGWSQSRAAAEWNRRWPNEPKTFKNFSYWEAWPSGGHAPAPENLARLAHLYECSVGDLLADQADYRHLDQFQGGDPVVRGDTPAIQTGEIVFPKDAETLLLDLLDRDGPNGPPDPAHPQARHIIALVRRLEEIDLNELAEVIMDWTRRLQGTFDRRAALAKLSGAFALAAAGPAAAAAAEAGHPAPMVDLTRFDVRTLAHCAEMVTHLKKQADVLGTQLTLPSAQGYRGFAQIQARTAPAALMDRAISIYAEFTELVGWLYFNIGDYRAAQQHYDLARSAAHEAKNAELVAYILGMMSNLANWQGKPRLGLDHAAAAAVWARQSGSPLARAYAADMTARAHVADNQPELGRAALEEMRSALRESHAAPREPFWYFLDDSCYWRGEATHALRFGRSNAALEAADRSLALVDPGNLHNRAFGMLFRAEAFLQHRQVAEASDVIREVVTLTAVNTTRRIDQRVSALRSALSPWQRSRSVRDLDRAIAAYRESSAIGKAPAVNPSGG